MNRSTELARLAISRHEATGMDLEASIAAAIRQALREADAIDQMAPLPHAAAGAVSLMLEHGCITPRMIAQRRAVSITAARKLVLRLHANGIADRCGYGTYRLARDWQRRACASVNRWHAGRLSGARRAAAVTNGRRVA